MSFIELNFKFENGGNVFGNDFMIISFVLVHIKSDKCVLDPLPMFFPQQNDEH